MKKKIFALSVKNIYLITVGLYNNEKKLRPANKNSRQTVTDLVVTEKVNVNQKLIRNIQAMIHDLKTNRIKK